MADRFMKNIIANQKQKVKNAVFSMAGSGAPVSGSGIYSISGMGGLFQTPPTGLGIAGPGSRYTDKDTGVQYFNEGTAAAPYWTPLGIDQKYLLGWDSFFKDGVGKALADTAATATIAGSGIRVFGQGIDETDAGFTVAIGEDGPIGTLVTTDEDAHVAALGVGITTSVPFQPDTHGPLVVEALWAGNAALTSRRYFLGFIGTAADALDPPVTGSTVTITLVQDDLAGMLMDSGLTNADGVFLPHNKSDEAATIATTATGVDVSVDASPAGTYQRWRVEISATGIMTAFINKVQVGQIVAALDVDEEVAPVFLVGSKTTATKAALVKRFAAWGYRRTGLF